MQGSGSPRPLFGGALSAVLPPNSTDVSELREIPDNQEVFTHPNTDQSLIVELLEYQDQVPDQDAARFHFEDIAGSNGAADAESRSVLSVAPLPGPGRGLALAECRSAWLLTGSQSVSKFNEAAQNVLRLHLAVFRLPQFSTDLLVSFNDPQVIHPQSSSSGGAAETRQAPWTEQDMHTLLHTLTLHNPGLFG